LTNALPFTCHHDAGLLRAVPVEINGEVLKQHDASAATHAQAGACVIAHAFITRKLIN
jgi:delta-aminolevulinic acid dehydratase/porphobilinogen synthase